MQTDINQRQKKCPHTRQAARNLREKIRGRERELDCDFVLVQRGDQVLQQIGAQQSGNVVGLDVIDARRRTDGKVNVREQLQEHTRAR